jgi:hypothetical protein
MDILSQSFNWAEEMPCHAIAHGTDLACVACQSWWHIIIGLARDTPESTDANAALPID